MMSTFDRPGSLDRAAADSAGRLRALKASSRAPGEASFFFYDATFKSIAVKVLPGEYFVSGDTDVVIMTTLGSCIAVCLWDRQAQIGGLNHFMLPDGSGQQGNGRYGSFAMELLINALMKQGASRSALEAKVFGGGQVIAGMHSLNVGVRNAAFAMDYLATERIAVASKDLLDVFPRKVCYLPSSGKAMVKRLPSSAASEMAEQDRVAAKQAAPVSAGGSVDLF